MSNLPAPWRDDDDLSVFAAMPRAHGLSVRGDRFTVRVLEEQFIAFIEAMAAENMMARMLITLDRTYLRAIGEALAEYDQFVAAHPNVNRERLMEMFYDGSTRLRTLMVSAFEQGSRQITGLIGHRPEYDDHSFRALLKDFFWWLSRE
jgi:hypothetical protein